jgi:hypothetical protein
VYGCIMPMGMGSSYTVSNIWKNFDASMIDEKPPGYIRGSMSLGQVMCTGSAAHDLCWCTFFMSSMHLHWYGCPCLATKKRGTHS